MKRRVPDAPLRGRRADAYDRAARRIADAAGVHQREPETVETAVEDFLARRKRGEPVDATEYARRHAHLGPELTDALEALLALEEARSEGSSTALEELPERVGAFRVVREVGRGGMGVVLEAVEEPLGRRVALKVLPAELLSSTAARARFRREAELAARLDHSGIATIYGAGVEDARPWIAMRFVEGRPLSTLVAEARSARRSCVAIPGANEREPEAAVASCFARIARALHAAHEQGVVHRDVKPSNVVVASDGSPVLLDFGLALPEESDGRSVTRTGDTAGTPAYLAPEQLDGEKPRADAQCDVYALGVSLYECLALRRPFDAPTPHALYRSIMIGDATSVRALNRAVPRDLAVVVSIAMERDRARRYASAAALAADLEACASGRPIAARPVPLHGKIARWVRREPRQAVLAVLLVVAVATVAWIGGNWLASRDVVRRAERLALEKDREETLARGFADLQTKRDARIEFERVLATDPHDLEAQAGRALAELERHRDGEALELLRDAPTTPGFEALRNLCRGRPVTQDAALRDDPGASSLDLFLVGTCLSRQADRGEYSLKPDTQQRALALLDEAVLRAPHARPLYHSALAAAASDANDERRARSAAGALAALWPDSGQPLLTAGTALYHFDPRAAASLLERAARAMPDDPAPPQVLANVYERLGDSARAESLLWHALALREEAETWNSLGISYWSRGCREEAIDAWSRAVACAPRNANARHNYAQGCFVLERWDEARQAFEIEMGLDPLSSRAHGLWAEIRMRDHALAEARPHLEMALALDPSVTAFWLSLASLERDVGQREEAIDTLDYAISLLAFTDQLEALRSEIAAGK